MMQNIIIGQKLINTIAIKKYFAFKNDSAI